MNATMTARTDERPVLKLAQCILTNENPLFDWSRVMSYGRRGLPRLQRPGVGNGSSLPLGDELLVFDVIDDGLSVAEHCCWDREVSVEERTVV